MRSTSPKVIFYRLLLKMKLPEKVRMYGNGMKLKSMEVPVRILYLKFLGECRLENFIKA